MRSLDHITLDPDYCRQFPRLELTGKLDKTSGLPTYELKRSVTVCFRIHSRAYIVVVPTGYVTDLASVPKALHPWFNPAAPCSALAAVLHDWLFSTQGLAHRAKGFHEHPVLAGSVHSTVSFEDCNGLLYLVMRANGASWIRSRLYLRATDKFGHSRWEACA